MRRVKQAKLTSSSSLFAMILTAVLFLSFARETAALPAEDVLSEMSQDQRHGYISGIVDGLAYARWLADQPDDTGMQCIYSWYYGGGTEKWALITQWLGRHLDKPVDALMYVLIKKECGE